MEGYTKNIMEVTITEYYQGDTIGFYIGGDAAHDLDENTFSVLFFTNSGRDIVFNKSDLSAKAANLYYGEIKNTITKGMQVGSYTEEVLLGEDYTSISKGVVFELKDSHAKKLIS